MSGEIKKYLEWKASNTSKAAITYEVHLRRFRKFLKEKAIEKITIFDVVRFLNREKQSFSPATTAYSAIILKNFFEFWLKQGRGVLDPWLIKIPKFQTRHHTTLTKEEYEKLSAVAYEDTFYEIEKKLVVKLLWETGIRVSELCDLNISDIDSQKPEAIIKNKKNKNYRIVVWSGETHSLLLKYLGVRVCLNQQPGLFIASKEGLGRDRLTPRTIQRWVKELTKRAGIERKISVHSFRHGWAIYRRGRGADLTFIQKGLGHTNPASSFVYQQLADRDFTKEAKSYLV